MTTAILLPGDEITSDQLPESANKSRALTLGPGLRHIPPSSIISTCAGQLHTDARKNAAWLENNGGRYIPHQNDLVIATLVKSSGEQYFLNLSPHTSNVILPHLSFENATRKTRPVLPPGALVYAQVTHTHKHMDTELSCVSATTGKSDGLGQLKGGMVFDVSLGMARRLMMGNAGGVVVLEAMAERVGFEVAVGRNGKIWVKAKDVHTTLAVGRAVQEVDQGNYDVRAQKECVKRALKGL